jgi:hypothetical protein
MTRTVQEIIDHADELAARFEGDEFEQYEPVDATPLREVYKAFRAKAEAEQNLHDAVTVAKGYGFSWADIGMMLGTSGEAVRQRYGSPATDAKASGAVRPTRRKKSTASRTARAAQQQRLAKASGAVRPTRRKKSTASRTARAAQQQRLAKKPPPAKRKRSPYKV